MCTAAAFNKGRHLFGRTLDVAASYGEEIIIIPRRFPLSFSGGAKSGSHLAFIGAGMLMGGFSLCFDGMNEAGLAAAALNFPGFAKYEKCGADEPSIASFEVIPKVLSECKTASEARMLLSSLKISDLSFSADLPPSPLHWIFSDKSETITVEQTENGLKIYDNPCGILTNAPEFPFHLKKLSEHASLSPKNPIGAKGEQLSFFSSGYGALGLPGDFSSPSRFIRASFLSKYTSIAGDAVNAFFHIMDSVSIPDGVMLDGEGIAHKTVYTSCMDTAAATYYFHTYKNRSIRSVTLDERTANLSEPTRISFL